MKIANQVEMVAGTHRFMFLKHQMKQIKIQNCR